MYFHAAAPPRDPKPGNGKFACAVAIPARDEIDLIAPCLLALAAQQGAPDFAVVLVLNNCRDGTAAKIKTLKGQLPFELHVYEIELPPALADAAWARRLATNAAVALVRADGIVLTTDADSRADPQWLRTTIEAFDSGADVVCGFVAPDFADAPPLSFDAIRRGALEYEYSQLMAEANSLIDPDPVDPWPSHVVESGQNLSIRAHYLVALGGVPHICPGEDQKLVAMARRAGARIRHSFSPSVTTSSRVKGRASGGWSDDLMSRLEDSRAQCHPKLEPARFVLRRAAIRAGVRRQFGGPAFAVHVARYLDDDAALADVTAAPRFEEAWARLEEHSPMLARHPLLAADLEGSATLLRAFVQRRTARASAPQSA
jgi:Glycosyl transferase family 2